MGSNRNELEDLPLVAGAITGLVTWLLGYASTYLAVAGEVRESRFQRFLEAFSGEPATYELVGWAFYNGHFVDVVFENVPLAGSWSENYVGGEGGLTVLLYLIPIGLLLAGGVGVARYRGATEPTTGLLAGLTVLPGYLVLSVTGAFLFEVTLGGASAAPDLLPAVLLAGIVYPAVFAGAGGLAAGLTGDGR